MHLPSWLTVIPLPKQYQFLATPHREALYGGAAGGGKSEALLMAALQYSDRPDYSALLLRRTYRDLALPGALIDRAHEVLRGTGATWNSQQHEWTLPSGATVAFGYLDKEADKYRYQGAEFQFIGFDELTQFSAAQYQFLASRLRRRAVSPVPLRMRAASNPGGTGHEWVKQRFLMDKDPERVFIPARLIDNPHLDRAGYMQSLGLLDHVTRSQLLDGDWDIEVAGEIFRRSWFRYHQTTADGWTTDRPTPRDECWRFATVDLAMSEGATGDYTAAAVWAMRQGQLLLVDLVRDRLAAPDVVRMLKELARRWDLDFTAVESNGPQKGVYQFLRREGVNARGLRPNGDKIARAKTASIAFERGDVWFPAGASWLEALERELLLFPAGSHDDQVDAIGYGVRLAYSSRRAGGLAMEGEHGDGA